MAISFLLLVALALLFSATSSAASAYALPPFNQSPSPPPPPPQSAEEAHEVLLLAPILSNLGFQELAMAVPALSSPVLSTWSGPLTLFAPSDDSLRSCPSCSPLRLLRDHLVPGLFPLPSLSALPFASKLATASPGRCLTVTSTAPHRRSGDNSSSSAASALKIFIDGVEIARPELFNDGRFVIHGLLGFVAPLSPFSCVQEPRGESNPASADPIRAGSGAAAAVVRLMLRDAIVRLREGGYSVLALAMRVKNAELSALSNMTVFALDDRAIFAGGHAYVTEVRFHVVPDRLLTHADLLRLPPGTLLPTLVRGQHLVVTHASAASPGSPSGPARSDLRINYVPIKVPDAVINSRVAIHGVLAPFPHLHLADLAAAEEGAREAAASAAPARRSGLCGASSPFGECAAAAAAGAPATPPSASFAVDFMDDGL
ncbi:fasciclin-like arabinogalactan protein 21 [Ananas comosus]|uniref:Fasciclin-like arabinogalactan protein 21 n=1 Tax=Ananas comosus TaxID=4615 RepID=A0A6P5G671_ANACO|nr:fasciclin-like arabinogalactan protein 21 [Ananas comosus]